MGYVGQLSVQPEPYLRNKFKMILGIDHIVLTINDMEKTISFYRDVMGMTVKEFQPVGGGETRKSLSFGN